MTFKQDRRTAVGAIGTALIFGCVTTLALAKPPRVIKVVAKKFVFVPASIRVRQGESVQLQLTAPEVPMGFSLPDFGVRTDIVPGQVAKVDLTPDKAGSFTFLCDVFCGAGHEDMNGLLVVTEAAGA